MTWQILTGDCRTILPTLPAGSVHTCVTSPPYYGLRDYGTNEQIGLEPTPDRYVTNLVEVFRDVRRVLRDDGTLWLNLGDSYAAKDLLGIPWLVAFALRTDGWYLRADIIWAKPNPMPESVTDRPTKAHEYVFLLSKRPRYFYDADAIREPPSDAFHVDRQPGVSIADYSRDSGRDDGGTHNGLAGFGIDPAGRNKRSVWTVATQPYDGAHFATFPPRLIEPCILAGSPERACSDCGAPWERVLEREQGQSATRGKQTWTNGSGTFQRDNPGGGIANLSGLSRTIAFAPSCTCDTSTAPGVVLDPFAGAGTTGLVALRHNRSFIGIELSEAYADMARWRIRDGRATPQHPRRTRGRRMTPGISDVRSNA